MIVISHNISKILLINFFRLNFILKCMYALFIEMVVVCTRMKYKAYSCLSFCARTESQPWGKHEYHVSTISSKPLLYVILVIRPTILTTG
jgi:hypothetical protein